MPLRVTTTMTGPSGAPYVSVMNFGGGTAIGAQDAASAVRSFWAAVALRMDNAITINVSPEVEEFSAATGDTTAIHSVTVTTVLGSNSGEPLPFATQGLISWRTGVFFGNRELRGRTFVPGLTEVESTEGRPTAAVLTVMNDAAAALIAGVSDFAVWSPTKLQIASVTSGRAWSEFAVLRSRRD